MGKLCTLLILGATISLLGIANIKGNISTIHWYNCTKVSEADAPKYGRAVGAGTLIIGIALILSAVLSLFVASDRLDIVAIVGCVVGLIVIVCAQLKYNHGLF